MAYSKKQVKSAKNFASNNMVALIVIILFLIIGIAGGIFGVYYLSKYDKYELIGDKEITINVGDTYLDKGITAIAFGKDVSSDVEVTNDVDTTKAGTYYVTYTSTTFKYRDVQRIRTVIVQDVNSQQ